MTTLRRYIAAEVFTATGVVMLALLMLFAFFDLVEQMKDLAHSGYRMRHITAYVLLYVPNHIYELFPIAALIGTLFALAQLAGTSEYTVMRTSGVSVRNMCGMLMASGVLLALLTFLVGEFIAPPAAQLAHRIRSQAITGIVAQEFRSGLWLKDDRRFINVREVNADSTLSGVQIYEFDGDYRLLSISRAQRGSYLIEREWLLQDVVETRFHGTATEVRRIPEVRWRSVLDPNLLNVLLVQPDRMSAWSLYSYAQHLRENRQKALRYEIAFWSKVFYPVAVLVMMILALPFATVQNRQGGVGGKIFTGIMLGLAFYFLNRLFGHLGLLNDWMPFASAIAPTLMFLTLAAAMIYRQERR